MTPVKKIQVKDIAISISEQAGREDYICLTDMVKAKDSADGAKLRSEIIIQNWMRNKDTVEYIGLWESINNPHLNTSNSMCLDHKQAQTVLFLLPRCGLRKLERLE